MNFKKKIDFRRTALVTLCAVSLEALAVNAILDNINEGRGANVREIYTEVAFSLLDSKNPAPQEITTYFLSRDGTVCSYNLTRTGELTIQKENGKPHKFIYDPKQGFDVLDSDIRRAIRHDLQPSDIEFCLDEFKPKYHLQ